MAITNGLRIKLRDMINDSVLEREDCDKAQRGGILTPPGKNPVSNSSNRRFREVGKVGFFRGRQIW